MHSPVSGKPRSKGMFPSGPSNHTLPTRKYIQQYQAHMARYVCPACSAPMSITETAEAYLMRCSCGISYTSNDMDRNTAFLRFLQEYDAGNMREDGPPGHGVGEMITGLDATMGEIVQGRIKNVCYHTTIESEGPQTGSSPAALGIDPILAAHLEDRGITALYRFQEESYRSIVSGDDTVIVAPTASGKTEAFLIPIVQAAMEMRRAVYTVIIYPTKALARDQYAKIRQTAECVGVSMAVFDGDTGPSERQKIIESPPHILVTNFDVINYHMPRHTRMAAMLRHVRILVIDEVHVYTGIFGSNVHHIIRRLGRICGRLQVVAASATVHEPERFCSELLDRDVRVIRGSGRRGKIDLAMLRPSEERQRHLMLEVADTLIRRKHKTIVFSNSHRGAELVAMQAKNRNSIRVHRAGLPAKYRQSIEDDFRDGSLMAISCTPTMEIGMDIGSVDGVVSTVVPVNRLYQRIGRAARGDRRGYAVMVLGNDPISQYYGNKPADYFEDSEIPYIDPKNPIILEYHTVAGACDGMLHEKNADPGSLSRCIKANLVHVVNGMVQPRHDHAYRMLNSYSIRGMGRGIDIVVEGKKAGERMLPMAIAELHPEAIYFMAGRKYMVQSLSYPVAHRAALVRMPDDYKYYTKPLTEESPIMLKAHQTRRMWETQISHATLNIRRSVTGYTTHRFGQDEAISQKAFDEPVTYDFVTKGIVFCAPAGSEDQDEKAGGYHAAEHTIIEGGSMVTGVTSQDLGGVSLGDTGAIFIYDAAIGGNGASKALYDRMELAIQRSRDILRMCPCTSEGGCPRCTYSYRCGNGNNYLRKTTALRTLERIMDGVHTDIAVPERIRIALV